METGMRRRSCPESIVAEFIARLPLRSIARFKSVCKQWRSLIESPYFRSLFVSLSPRLILLFLVSNDLNRVGCERWDLPKSPASYFMPFQPYPNLPTFDYHYIDSSNGLVWIEVYMGNCKFKSFVGNPVSQEWVEIPPPPPDCPRNMPSGLVTHVVNGVVSSFKMVWTSYKLIEYIKRRYEWRVYVYSSETGTWTHKRLSSSFPLKLAGFQCPLNLDGMVYEWEKRSDDDDTGPGVLVAYDFFAEVDDNQCRIIPLPVPYSKCVSRCLSTSGGDVIYVEILDRRLKVWKLKSDNSDGKWWQLTILWALMSIVFLWELTRLTLIRSIYGVDNTVCGIR